MKALNVLACLFATALSTGVPARAQDGQEKTATAALTAALVIACRQDEARFAAYLTRDTADAFGKLQPQQRLELMRRLILFSEPGKPLLSSDARGRAVVRCSSGGAAIEFRFDGERLGENFAFVAVDAVADPPQSTGGAPRRVEFGLIREGGGWRIFSVGLLVLNLPELSRQWAEQDIEARERAAIQYLRLLADKIRVYERAFGRLPETLEQLGPSKDGQISTDAANLIEAEFAAGRIAGYVLRYRIVSPDTSKTTSTDELAPAFEIAAAPAEYGKTGRRSFFLDSTGVLRGADRQGAVATREDPRIEPHM